MRNFTVVFAHGKESGPWGTKIRALAKVAEQMGGRVVSRDDSDTRDPEVRVSRMLDEVKQLRGPVILVGSSMGGYVAAVAAQAVHPKGLFLLAPALGMPGYEAQEISLDVDEISIVHGWGDDVVPVEPVQRFARQQQAMLHMVPAGHALIEQVDWVTQVFSIFLQRCLSRSPCRTEGRLLATL